MSEVATIEQGRVAHAAPLQQYWAGLRTPSDEWFPRRGEVSLPDIITRLGHYAERPDAAMFVACDGTDIVGVVDAEGDDTGAMEVTLTVHQAHRGRGLGGALLGEALRWGESVGALTRARLQVLVDNTQARRLYETHGFSPAGPPRLLARRAGREIWDLTLIRPLDAAGS